jgi:hypothetical protein
MKPSFVLRSPSAMNYQEIRNNPTQFLSLTSLSTAQFDKLLPGFEALYLDRIENRTLKGTLRTKKYKARRATVVLTIEIMLFFILIYVKTNPLQEAHAAAFGIKQDGCNRLIHLLAPLLKKALAEFQPDESKVAPISEIPLLMDVTERPVERDRYEQRRFYSGKKNFIR